MLRSKTIFVCTTFALTGCLATDDDAILSPHATAAATRKGVDYAWAPHPSPSVLHDAGYTFAVRYLSHDDSKDLTAAEARDLQAAGVDVVSNWEAGTSDALKGHDRGVSDAQEADAKATAAGMPAGRPIYFSVDFDATEGQQAVLNQYFDGAASVLGHERTGAYGGYYVIKRLFDANKITYGWQTTAWSGGQWDERAQLRQVDNGVTIDGADCDIDEAHADDFGQWGATPTAPVQPLADVEKVAAARDVAGHVEVFWLAAGGAIHYATQTGGTTGWGSDATLGGNAKKLAVGSHADGRLEVFYVGTNNMLFHRAQLAGGGWSDELAFGVAATELAVGRNSDGRLEVFFTAGDGTISHVWQTAANGDWSGAVVLGGGAKDLFVDANLDGRLELFYVGTNDMLYHRAQLSTGNWSSEMAFGVQASDLAVGRNLDGRLEVFYAGNAGAIGHAWQTAANGNWTAPTALGGAAKQITVGANADGRLEVFYRGTNDQLYHRVQLPTGNWSSELTFGTAGRDLAITANADGRLELLYANASGALSHSWQLAANGNWSGSAPIVGTVE